MTASKRAARVRRIATTDPLIEAAQAAAKHAHAPYSHFAVGAAVETRDGKVFTGANMENASYGLSVCAEVGALQAATTAGELKNVQRIAIVGGPRRPGASYVPRPTPPCGRCRQLIAEAAMVAGNDIDVVYADTKATVVRRRRISMLLPDAFDPSTLGRKNQR